MKDTKVVVAFFVSAIFAALAPFMAACAMNLVLTGNCDVDFWWSLFALAITFAATIFIAVPLFFLFRKLGLFRWWQICLGGGVVGLLSAMIIQVADSGSSWIWYQFAALTVPLGTLSGLVFWWVGVRKNIDVSA